jgi:hypothetical protein
MGFWVSQSLTSLSARTLIGLRPAPLAVSTATGFIALRPHPLSIMKASVLSQTSTPLQSFTQSLSMARATRLTHLTVRPTNSVNHATFQGFFPFSVCSHSEPQISCPFPRTCPVTPLGFRNPSMFCSPNDLPSLFHPGPTLGIRSSRPCSPSGAVDPLESRSPPDV